MLIQFKFFLVLHTLTKLASPCINWCEMNPQSGYCRGCFRTLTEIANWSVLSQQEKLEVLQQITIRNPQADK